MNYDELDVYKEAHKIVLDVYQITKTFPKTEQFNLISQITRAAYSIPSNIAVGNSRNTTKEYINFLYISRGSLGELRYFLLLSKDLEYISVDLYNQMVEKCDRIAKMLNSLINHLKKLKK
ncbi:MAG: four helix bundle protein [Candidatus Wallbacteria bacterium]|nr:four helix bundle protein [Candidatus Wallbacteria bacterium]